MNSRFINTLCDGVFHRNKFYAVKKAGLTRALIDMNYLTTHLISTTAQIPTAKQVSIVKHSGIEIPDIVRGMTDLKKDLFLNNILFTVMKVDATKVSVIQRKVRLEKYLIKNMGRVKLISLSPFEFIRVYIVILSPLWMRMIQNISCCSSIHLPSMSPPAD